RHRQAFGRAILEYPLVEESLADMRAEAEAMLSSTLYLAARQDELDAVPDQADPAATAFVRMAVDLNKTRTAASAREIVTQAILVLGGNGAIETFSVLPRLLRDAIVFENWEGTPNTLLMQSLRDAARYHVHEGFFAHLDRILGAAADSSGPVAALAGELRGEVRAVRTALEEGLRAPPSLEEAAPALRPWLDPIALTAQAVIRVGEEARLGATRVPATLEHFIDAKLRGRRTRETDPRGYLERIRTISASL